jgi:hypothetical protein
MRLIDMSDDLFKKKKNQHYVDVEVTKMTKDERLKVMSEYKSKPGFVSFSTGWENQFTPNEKMFYTFWYEKKPKE